MPDQGGMCEPEWISAKKTFESRTHQKKPTEKFLIFFRKGTGIESSLAKMDKIYTEISKERDAGQRLKKATDYEKEIEIFSRHRKEYKEVLNKAVEAEAEGSRDFFKAQITLLTKQLSATEAGARINALTQKLEAEKQMAAATKAPSANKDDKKREQAAEQAKKMAPALKSALKSAALFAAQVKAAPTAQVFNDGIQSATRKVTQNLAWVEKINTQIGESFGLDVDKAQRLNKVMTAWSDGGRRVPADAKEAIVLRELGALLQTLTAANLMLKTMEQRLGK